ncbi:dihydrolipoyl dehydrogenase family protein [Maribacter sp. ACAM166]|uniref:dihydrolipoyl dehydrogenase family protein n=1 Tax=Maribacter sp. ACAM166 TaxID=2508996 RepID=UPI002017D643|nr:NAD(P)/FAD-dependent oxidoreductase [Maribacter sp. ACAM166]
MTQNLIGKGICKSTTINWEQLQKFKRSFTENIPASTEKKLKELGMKLYHQSPKFVDEHTLLVEGETVTASQILIVTGLVPRTLSITGSKHIKISDDFLNLKKLPKSIVLIGAGYIGMEFAHIAARSGAEVTVIDTGKRPLKAFDPDLVKELTKYSESIGIKFIFGAKPIAVKKKRKRFKLSYEVKGASKTIKTYVVFNIAGRVPALSNLDLERGNIAFNEIGIETNVYLQSASNSNVYACGDVSDKNVPLTPLSGRQGHLVLENMLKGNQQQLEVPVIPSLVFTLPNLATVGYSEKEVSSKYKNIRVNFEVETGWFNAKHINVPLYAYKIITNDRTGEIVGAHLLGPHAGKQLIFLHSPSIRG